MQVVKCRGLLDAGADVDVHDHSGVTGWSALMHAANNRHVRLAELLLQRGANVNFVVGAGACEHAYAAAGPTVVGMRMLLLVPRLWACGCCCWSHGCGHADAAAGPTVVGIGDGG
eukprot:360999-Chlamydomonas_euryale.AAC.14